MPSATLRDEVEAKDEQEEIFAEAGGPSPFRLEMFR